MVSLALQLAFIHDSPCEIYLTLTAEMPMNEDEENADV